MSAMSLAILLRLIAQKFFIHQVSHSKMGCNLKLFCSVGTDATLTLTLSVNRLKLSFCFNLSAEDLRHRDILALSAQGPAYCGYFNEISH